MFLLHFLPLFFFSLSAQAAAPSGEKWLTLHTPNFRVHHTAPLEIYARTFAASLERALPKLESDLRWKLPVPVDIVVMDPSDAANGFAANFPNTHMEVYAVPFDKDSSLGHYYNWVNELATHELTHLIANDTTHGFYSPLRSIFGSWVKPNGMQANWLIEGLAVYEETAHTSGGRGRSPLFLALLREAAHTRQLTSSDYTSIDRFNDGNGWWPGRDMAYLMGYTIQALPSHNRPGLPGELSYLNAGQLPFQPNRKIESLTGKDWSTIWSESTSRLQAHLPRAQLPAPCRLTRSGRHTGGQALSADGWIYFSEEDHDHGHHLARIPANAPCENTEVGRLDYRYLSAPNQIAVSADGKKVAYAAYDTAPFERFFSKLYLWEDGSTSAIPNTLRGRDPAFTQDGLLYIRENNDTSQSILWQSLSSEQERVLFTGPPLERLSGLFVQGSTAVFSWHKNQGAERIYKLSLEGGGPVLVTRQDTALPAYERNPFLNANGDIYFAGSYGYGPQEIYRVSAKTKNIDLVLSSRSGYVDRPIPLDAEGKSLLVQAYGLNGLDLARLESTASQASPSPKEDLHQFLTNQAPAPEPPSSPESRGDSFPPSQPYRALSSPATSLWPQYWLPEIVAAEEGFLVGASTGGNDPLEYHRYGLLAQYDTRATFPIYSAFYNNRMYKTQFFLQARQTNSYFISRDLSNRSATYSAEFGFPLYETYLSFGAAFQERTLFGRATQSTIAFHNFNYTRVGQSPSAMEPNYGMSFNAYAAVFPKARNERLFFETRPKLDIYARGFHPSHSVSLAANAGITTNSILASNYYLGGGPSPLSPSTFVVRGYPLDTLFGQRIATVNLAYTLPLAHPHRGLGTAPLFIESWGLKFLADAGTSSLVARYRSNVFLGYEMDSFGENILSGVGVDLLLKGSAFYHLPLTLQTGIHYGLEDRFGGDWIFFLGLNVGMFGTSSAVTNKTETHSSL